MTDQLELELRKIGLADKEARVYLAGLALGPSTAQQIAAKATVNRPTTYIMIETLIKRGLMTSFQREKKRFFLAAPPNQLLYVLNDQKKELDERERSVRDILVRLESMSKASVPAFSVYEGLEGVRRLQENVYASDPASEICEMSSLDHARKHIPPTFAGDLREKIAEKFRVKSLFVTGEAAQSSGRGRRAAAQGNVESRRLDEKRFPFSCDVVVFGEKAAFVTYGDKPICYIIHDALLSATMRAVFMGLWDQAR